MSFYVCRRPFRDALGPVTAGSVIDPAVIKRFRHRLQERHIVEVTRENFEEYRHLFRIRYGVELQWPMTSKNEESIPTEDSGATVDSGAAEETKPVATATPVARAIVSGG